MRSVLLFGSLAVLCAGAAIADDYHVPSDGYVQVLNLPGMFFKGSTCTGNTLRFTIYNEYSHSVYADVSAEAVGGTPVLPFALRYRFEPYTYTPWTTTGFNCSEPRFQAMIVNVRFGDDTGPEIVAYQPVTAPAAPPPVPNPSNPSGTGMSGTLPYAGTNADAARFLLQHVGGWSLYSDASKDVFPPTPSSLSCIRDSYVYAAADYAFAANAHVASGNAAAAVGNAQGMMQQLRNAASLCSTVPVIAGGGGCQTDWLSCDTLRSFLSE